MAAPNRDPVSLHSRPRRRDLSDVRLWEASLHRSAERRRAAARARRGVDPRTATASLAIVVAAGAAATPAASIAAPVAGGGLAAVQKALGVDADGVMGPETRAAIRAFQRSHGLPVDGVAGQRTVALLGIEGGSSRAEAPTTDASSAVRRAQTALGVTADGVLGPQTRAALRHFQAAHGLPATGRVDAATSTALDQGEAPAAATKTTDPAVATAPAAAAAPAPAAGVQAAVAAAQTQVGKPYARSGTGPSGFDCSGLTAFAFKAAGISLARSSYGQYAQGTAVAKPQIQAGDLVFFDTAGAGASHVGVATSATTMISATTHGVMQTDFTSGYWASHYVGARRVT